MAQDIVGVACGDTFTNAASIMDVYLPAGGVFEVQDQPAIYQLQYGALTGEKAGQQGSDFWTRETQIGTGGGDIPKGVTGIRFKNASPGVVATVSATIRGINEPFLSLSFPAPTSGNIVVIPEIVLASFPPLAPTDGQTVTLVLPSSFDPVGGKTLRWLLQFNATENVWDFVGGPSLFAEVATLETFTIAAGYGDAPTPGPAVTLPRPGDYNVEIGCYVSSLGVGVNMSYQIGGIGAVDADSIQAQTGNAQSENRNSSRRREKTGLAAVTLTAKYKTNNGGTNFGSRYMQVAPIRIT